MVMRNVVAMSVVFGSVVLFGGCVWGRRQVNDPTIADRARAIKVGVTKGADLPAIVGVQPTLRKTGKDLMVCEYSYGDTKVCNLNLIVVNFGRSSTVNETVYVEVDTRSDIVTKLYIPPKHEIEWRFWPFD